MAQKVTAPLQQVPYTLNMDRDPNRALVFNKKPGSTTREGERDSRSSVVVFPTLKQATQFRDEFVTCSNVQHREWDARPRPMFDDDVFGVSYLAKIQFNRRNHQTNPIVPMPFEFENPEYLDKLITYNVSAFLFDGYVYSPTERALTVFGNVWTPPKNIMYYPSDVESLYQN